MLLHSVLIKLDNINFEPYSNKDLKEAQLKTINGFHLPKIHNNTTLIVKFNSDCMTKAHTPTPI